MSRKNDLVRSFSATATEHGWTLEAPQELSTGGTLLSIHRRLGSIRRIVSVVVGSRGGVRATLASYFDRDQYSMTEPELEETKDDARVRYWLRHSFYDQPNSAGGRRNMAGSSTQEKVQRVIDSIMKIGSMIHRQNVQHQVGTDAFEAIARYAEPRMTAREVASAVRNHFDLISSSVPFEMALYEGGYQKGKSRFHGQSKGERPGGGTSGYVKSKLIIRFAR